MTSRSRNPRHRLGVQVGPGESGEPQDTPTFDEVVRKMLDTPPKPKKDKGRQAQTGPKSDKMSARTQIDPLVILVTAFAVTWFCVQAVFGG